MKIILVKSSFLALLLTYSFSSVGSCPELLNKFIKLSSETSALKTRAISEFGYGPMIRYVPGISSNSRDVEDIKSLRLGSYNTLNLTEHLGKWIRNDAGELVQVGRKSGKPLQHLQEMGKIFNEMNLDIISLQEIENVEALKFFNKNFLNSKYEPFLIQGQDRRGVQVAFLVKKDLPFIIEYNSFKNLPGIYKGQKGPIFSRDLPVLLVKDSTNKDKIYAAFGGTHFKSMRDSSNDKHSTIKRRKQAEASLKVRDLFYARYGEIPFFIMGDFNNDIRHAREFSSLRGEFQDAFDIAFDQVGMGEGFGRTTHTYHPRGGATSNKQIDGILVSGSNDNLVSEAGIYRYRNQNEEPKPIPKTYEDRKKNPSDHFPIWAVINFLKLIQRNID